MSDDVVTQVVQTAVVRPGDTLIVRVAPSSTPSWAQQIGAALRERLPDMTIVVVAAEELVVYRSEPPLYNVHLGAEASRAIKEGVERASRAPEQRRRTG